jgi:hypothetical protein
MFVFPTPPCSRGPSGEHGRSWGGVDSWTTQQQSAKCDASDGSVTDAGDIVGNASFARPPGLSSDNIVPKRSEEQIRHGPAEGSGVGDKVGRRQTPHWRRPSNLAQKAPTGTGFRSVLPDSAPTTASQREVRSRSGMVQQEESDLGVNVGRRQTPHWRRQSNLAQCRRRGRASGASSRIHPINSVPTRSEKQICHLAWSSRRVRSGSLSGPLVTGKNATCFADRTMLKGANGGGISVRPLGSSPFTIVQSLM